MKGNFDYGPDNLLKTEINISTGSEPLFSLIKITDIANNQVVYSEIDSTIEDGYSSLVSTDFNPGLYSLQNSVFFGSNQQVSHTQLFYQNGVYSYAGITNSEISRIEDDLEDARDSVQRLRRRYDNLDSLRRENDRKARDEDDEAWSDDEIASQLEKIDRVLDQVEDIYSDDLRDLLDSIVNYPDIPDTAALHNYVDQLQDELDKCKKQLQDLEDEKSKLEKDIPNIQARQQAAYQKIVDAFKGSGYNFMARRSRDANGDFHYGFTVVLGTTGYKGYVPAEIASQVDAQENELKDLANQLQQARQRLAELPGIIADKQKECDDLNDQLQKAKEALKNGTNLAQNYGRMQLKRDDICKRIKAISQRLVRWCDDHPDLCSFADDLEKLLDNCPKTAAEADNFWRNYQRVLDAKKRLENNYHESSKTHSSNADDLRKRADDESDEQNDIWDELGRLARRIQRLEAAKARAIADEQRRQAQMAREKKRACEKILEQQGIDPSNASVLKDLEDIKDKIQEVGGMISDAAKLGEKIPNAKIKEMAEKLGKNIDEILGPLEKFDELKDKADKLLEVKDKLATLFSEGDSPSEQAAKFGAYLGLVNDIVGEIGDKFPILKFFTAYFDYLVQGYLAAVNGAERAFTDRYEEIIESGLDRLNCEQLLEKYMKNNSFEDMYRYAEKACGISYYGQNKWQRENFSRIVREKALKKIIDCCLYKLSK